MTTNTTRSSNVRLRVGALAGGGAVLAVALVWTAAQFLGIELRVDPRNGQPPGTISLTFAAAVALVVSILGWSTRVLLGRLTSRAATVWTMLAAAVLLVSFLALFVVDAVGSAKAMLALMHLAVAAVLIPVLGWPISFRRD